MAHTTEHAILEQLGQQLSPGSPGETPASLPDPVGRSDAQDPLQNRFLQAIFGPLPKQFSPQQYAKDNYGVDLSKMELSSPGMYRIRRLMGLTEQEDQYRYLLPIIAEEHKKAVAQYRSALIKQAETTPLGALLQAGTPGIPGSAPSLHGPGPGTTITSSRRPLMDTPQMGQVSGFAEDPRGATTFPYENLILDTLQPPTINYAFGADTPIGDPRDQDHLPPSTTSPLDPRIRPPVPDIPAQPGTYLGVPQNDAMMTALTNAARLGARITSPELHATALSHQAASPELVAALDLPPETRMSVKEAEFVSKAKEAQSKVNPYAGLPIEIMAYLSGGNPGRQRLENTPENVGAAVAHLRQEHGRTKLQEARNQAEMAVGTQTQNAAARQFGYPLLSDVPTAEVPAVLRLAQKLGHIDTPYANLSTDVASYLKGANPEKKELEITPENIAAAFDAVQQQRSDRKEEDARNVARAHVGTQTQNAAALQHGYASFADVPTAEVPAVLADAKRLSTPMSSMEPVKPEHAHLHGQAYLDTLDPGLQNIVRALHTYDMPITTLSARAGERKHAMEHTFQAYPDFSIPKYGIRYAVTKDFTSGPIAANIVTIDQAINHIGTLVELGHGLQNKDVRAFNAVVNEVKTATGNPSVNNYQTAMQAVATELMRTFRQVQGSEKEVAAWEKRLSVDNSLPIIQGAAGVAVKLLGGRINAINTRWNNGMEVTTGYPNVLSPQALEVLKTLGVSRKSIGITGPAPSDADYLQHLLLEEKDKLGMGR